MISESLHDFSIHLDIYSFISNLVLVLTVLGCEAMRDSEL
jgi:hypothetical protein